MFVAAMMTNVFARFEQLKKEVQPHRDLAVCFFLTLASLVVYLRTAAPGVLDGDSGEWQYMANILGIPHSTGYPLYVLLAKLVTLLPFGNPAWRVTLFSALCAALTLPLVYLIARRLAGSRRAALLASTFFAFMPTLWASATIAEVYAFNSLLIAFTLWCTIRFLDARQPGNLYLMAFSFGLALTNHRIAFFLVPGLLLVVWLRRQVLSPRRFALAALVLLLPLLLYAYIPIRATQLLADQSPQNWDLYPRPEAIVNGKITAFYNHTPQGFVNLVTALDNTSKVGFQSESANNTLGARLGNAWGLLREQMDPFALALALLGIVILWRRERALTAVLLGAGSGIALVAVIVRAESTRFYFSGAYLVLVLFLAVAVGWVLEQLERRAVLDKRWTMRGLELAAIVYFAFLPLTALWFNYSRMDQSGNTRYDTYARNVLDDHLATDAVLVAPWEVATPIRYLQYVEGVRPDVLTIHESPIRPQYQKLLDAAHRLRRPFYYAQFIPEDKNSDGPRTVQAIAFPLPDKPHPQHPLAFPLNDAMRIVGYDWTVLSDRTARLAIYYHVLKPTRTEYVSEFELSDAQQATQGHITRHPVSEYYPTYLWKQGDYYRDVYDVRLASDAPSGAYSGELDWYEYDAGTARRNEDSIVTLTLPTLPVNN